MNEYDSNSREALVAELMHLAISGKFESIVKSAEQGVKVEEGYDKFREAVSHVQNLMESLRLFE